MLFQVLEREGFKVRRRLDGTRLQCRTARPRVWGRYLHLRLTHSVEGWLDVVLDELTIAEIAGAHRRLSGVRGVRDVLAAVCLPRESTRISRACQRASRVHHSR